MRSVLKQVRETQAEAVAFVVCQSVGFQTGTTSADYIQLWHGDANLLREIGSCSANRCRDPRGHCPRAGGTRGCRITAPILHRSVFRPNVCADSRNDKTINWTLRTTSADCLNQKAAAQVPETCAA
jgi:hypothetical protein